MGQLVFADRTVFRGRREHREPKGDIVGAVQQILDRLSRPEGGDRMLPAALAAAERALAVASRNEVVMQDLREQVAALERLVVTDPLTGVLNRRGFENELGRALALARRYDEPGVLVYLDIDEFKAINDRYGHAGGDEVLRTIAGTLAKWVRSTDSVGRLGGDEFAVLMPRANLEGAKHRLHDLSALFRPAVIPFAATMIEVRASMGAQTFDGKNGLDPHALMARADDSMYADKRSRDNTTTARPAARLTA